VPLSQYTSSRLLASRTQNEVSFMRVDTSDSVCWPQGHSGTRAIDRRTRVPAGDI
ncbi:hypothetical protein BaRGS_00040158, partial [Batillaria attramentaria]